MADWHLSELRQELERKGWRVLAEHSGNDHDVSGSWEVQRSTRATPLVIDFEGLDDMVCLPMHRSYACQVRSHPQVSLYFGKGRSRRWKTELTAFVKALDSMQ